MRTEKEEKLVNALRHIAMLATHWEQPETAILRGGIPYEVGEKQITVNSLFDRFKKIAGDAITETL